MIKNISFKNARGEIIKGVLQTTSNNPQAPLLIVCHGYKSSHNHPAIESITEKLYLMGNSTFSFTFSQSAQGIHLMQQIADINDILTYFKDHKHKILLAGSFGALSSVIAATKSPQVNGLITVNGFFGSWQLGMPLVTKYFLIKCISLFRKTYRDNWQYLKHAYKPENISASTLVIYGKHDKDISSSQSKDFFKKLGGRKELCILENADHHLTRESDRKEVATIIDKWVKAHF